MSWFDRFGLWLLETLFGTVEHATFERRADRW